MADQNPLSQLEPGLRESMEKMLLGGEPYGDVADFLEKQGAHVRLEDISDFAVSLNADAAALRTAQSELRQMMREADSCPELDATDALLHLASGHVLRVLAGAGEAEWAEMDKEKLLSSAIGLARAAVYKKRADFDIHGKTEAGIAYIKETVFGALKQERPLLYRDMLAFLDEKKNTLAGG